MHRGKHNKFTARVDHLFTKTVTGRREGDRAWKAITTLRMSGSRFVFDRAARWTRSRDPLKRSRAVTVLCQLGKYDRGPVGVPWSAPEWMFRDESFMLITRSLEAETDPDVLHSALIGLGHLGKIEAVPHIVRYCRHQNALVRYGVAVALGSYADETASVAALLELVTDSDSQVRNWAVFGLGVQGRADSEEIRVAFLKRLEDSFLDVRMEAAAALGIRHDARVASPLIRMLNRNGTLYGLVDAAKELLEMEQEPEGWFAEEYIAAIREKFL